MDVLSEWLKTTILHELSDGLRWLDGGSGNSGANVSHFEDDGNTLRAKVSKSGVVQITKVRDTLFIGLFSVMEHHRLTPTHSW